MEKMLIGKIINLTNGTQAGNALPDTIFNINPGKRKVKQTTKAASRPTKIKLFFNKGNVFLF